MSMRRISPPHELGRWLCISLLVSGCTDSAGRERVERPSVDTGRMVTANTAGRTARAGDAGAAPRRLSPVREP